LNAQLHAVGAGSVQIGWHMLIWVDQGKGKIPAAIRGTS
jgi:hypothetical protein